jgi:hypothetical protein
MNAAFQTTQRQFRHGAREIRRYTRNGDGGGDLLP